MTTLPPRMTTSEDFLSKTWVKMTLFWGGIVLLVLGAFLSIWGRSTTEATIGVTYAAAIVCLFLCFASRFRTLQAPGIKLEMLEDKIKEADTIISQLRRIAVPMAELLMTNAARGNRLVGTLPRREQARLVKALEEGLRSAGVTDEEISNAEKQLHHFNIFDLAARVRRKIQRGLQSKRQAIEEAIAGYKQPINAGDPAWATITDQLAEAHRQERRLKEILALPSLETVDQELLKFIRECPAWSAGERTTLLNETKAEFDELEYYIKNREFASLIDPEDD